MAIIGIETLVYGVDKFEESVRFFEDFGLPLESRTEGLARFRLAEGSHVEIRPLSDPCFRKSEQDGIGVRECIWGVDNQASFKALLADLSRDHDITLDAEGAAHFVTEFGQAIGLKVWTKKPLFSAPSPHNSPGNIQRVNEHRKWIKRAIPKTIQHVVWAFPDVNQALGFYRDRLHFRLTDMQIGFGVYMRADGAPDHHNIFIADASLDILGFNHRLKFHHANFGVEDIDELMIGKNYMERRGWPKSDWGMGRHRIGSGAFLYLECPAGGEAEYGADSDMLDDRWVPRVWNSRFGTALYIHNLPHFMEDEIEWDVGYGDPKARYISFKEAAATGVKAATAKVLA